MKRLALLSVLIVSAHLIAFSQQAATATLKGTISDQMGAVIAGTRVTATQTATGIKREAVTNNDGLYVFSNMAPGDYELSFGAPGFATKVTKLALNVGQTLTFNTQLEVDITRVDVHQITAPRIDNSNSVIDGVIQSREVRSLPLNGRNFLELE